VLKVVNFSGKLLNMYKPEEVSWIFTIVILVLGVGLVAVAQYYAKKSEMV
jgi:hypothetical protein